LGARDVVLDDNSGAYEPGTDIVVLTLDDLVLGNGVQTISFTDGDPNVQFMVGRPRSYFVVLKLTSDAGQQGINLIQLTHLTESSSAGEDRDNDMPGRLEYSENLTSTIIIGELGDANRVSSELWAIY
jgi:hypothetical protein